MNKLTVLKSYNFGLTFIFYQVFQMYVVGWKYWEREKKERERETKEALIWKISFNIIYRRGISKNSINCIQKMKGGERADDASLSFSRGKLIQNKIQKPFSNLLKQINMLTLLIFIVFNKINSDRSKIISPRGSQIFINACHQFKYQRFFCFFFSKYLKNGWNYFD